MRHRQDKREKAREGSGGTGVRTEPKKGRMGVLTPMDLLREGMLFLLLDGLVSYLFYRSWAAFLLLLALFPFYLRERRRDLEEARRSRIRGEFLTGIQLFNTALQAGYSPENAMQEALKELEKICGEASFIVTEFRRICARLKLNVSLERLLAEMAWRSGVEDILSFAEVFAAARRAGGDLIAVSRNTVLLIRQKEETRLRIETALSGKKLEQNMMSLIPMLILGYVGLTSDGFLEPMYHTPVGIAVMSAALGVYLAAYLWGKRIMQIQV